MGSAATDGASPWMVFCSWSLNLIYQFWVHTERIDRLPRWFEFVFNTPSHHRVHHGMDPVYLDKNYGGILIIWDRLFGSFQPELFRPHYGLTKRVDTFNIWKLQTREYVAIVRDWRSATRLRDRLGYVFGPPGWEPRTIDKSNAAASWSRLGNVATRHCESITVGFWYALAVTGGGRCAWPRRMGVQGGPPGTTRIRSDGRPIGGRVFAGDRQCRSGLGVPRHGNPSGQPRLHPGLRRPSSENRVYRGALSGRGAVTSRDYKVIGHLRAFRDNTPSGSTVATHELIADYEAIVLADDVTASNILPSGRALESRPGVVLHPGQAVCHFGVSTGETCGTVESVNNGWFTMSHGVLSEKGDSGAWSTWPPMAAPRRSSGSSTASGAAFPRRCPGGRRPSRFTRISA